jgi:hypothetical protein
MMSGELGELLAQTSFLNHEGLLAGAARAPSFNIGKLESLNMSDEMMAAAIMQMERAGGGTGASLPPAARQPSAAAAALAAAAAAAREHAAPSAGGAANARRGDGVAGEAGGGEGQDGRLTPSKRKAS